MSKVGMHFLSGDPRRLEQLQLKQTPLIHCRYVVIEVQINGKNVALRVSSTQIRMKNSNSLEYAVWCEIEHYFYTSAVPDIALYSW